jgi:hypothetical protein
MPPLHCNDNMAQNSSTSRTGRKSVYLCLHLREYQSEVNVMLEQSVKNKFILQEYQILVFYTAESCKS